MFWRMVDGGLRFVTEKTIIATQITSYISNKYHTMVHYDTNLPKSPKLDLARPSQVHSKPYPIPIPIPIPPSIDHLLRSTHLRPSTNPIHTLIPIRVTTILIRQTRPIILLATRPLLIRRPTLARSTIARAAVSDRVIGQIAVC